MSRQLTAAIAVEAPNTEASQTEIGAMPRIVRFYLPSRWTAANRGSKTALSQTGANRYKNDAASVRVTAIGGDAPGPLFARHVPRTQGFPSSGIGRSFNRRTASSSAR